MHLKILIVLVTLGLSGVSAKAKASPQGFLNVPFYPFSGFTLPQNNVAHQFSGAQPYQVGFVFGNNQGFSSNAISGPVLVNPQTYQGAHYFHQFSVPIGVPITYAVQSANNFERLWPKNLVDPNGTPSPPISGPDPLNYVPVSSTPSPLTYQSNNNYDNSPLVRKSQQPTTSPKPIQNSQRVQVPVEFDSRSSFHQDTASYNNVQINQNSPIIASTLAPYLVSHQQPSSFLPGFQSFQIFPSSSSYLGSFVQPTASSYLVQYQHPSASPFIFQNHVTASPVPFLINNNQPYVNNRQFTSTSNVNPNQQAIKFPSASLNQEPVSSDLVDSYQQSITTPTPYQNLINEQKSAPSYVSQNSPAADFVRKYQPSAEPVSKEQALPSENIEQLQQDSESPPIIQYEEPSSSSYAESEETTPTVLIGQHKSNKSPAQNQIEPDSTKSTSITQFTKAPTKTHSVTIVSTTPIAQTEPITENKLTTPTPITLRPEIIKTEYSGLVSPQYNHINSTPSPFRSLFSRLSGQPAYVPLRNFNSYSSTTIVPQKYNGLERNYSYSKL